MNTKKKGKETGRNREAKEERGKAERRQEEGKKN
jgi:hypothetical protein